MNNDDMVTVKLGPNFGHTQRGIRHLPGAVIDVPRRVLEAFPDRMTALGTGAPTLVHAVAPQAAPEPSVVYASDVAPPEEVEEPKAEGEAQPEEAGSAPVALHDFQGMTKLELERMAEKLHIPVTKTGLSETPLKRDYIKALEQAASEG